MSLAVLGQACTPQLMRAIGRITKQRMDCLDRCHIQRTAGSVAKHSTLAFTTNLLLCKQDTCRFNRFRMKCCRYR